PPAPWQKRIAGARGSRRPADRPTTSRKPRPDVVERRAHSAPRANRTPRYADRAGSGENDRYPEAPHGTADLRETQCSPSHVRKNPRASTCIAHPALAWLRAGPSRADATL